MKGLRLVTVTLLASLMIFTMSISCLAADPIKFGIVGPMKFTQGEGHWNGATLAAEEINAKGGIDVGGTKRPIKLVKVDSNEHVSIPDATNAIEQAISREKVDFLVGGFRTEAVLVMQDIAMDNKKIFMGCGAADISLCERVTKDYDRYKYWFRVTPINNKLLGKVDFIQLGTVAKTMAMQLKIPKIKVAIVAEKAAWADVIVAYAKKVIPGKLKCEVAGVWRPSPRATNTTAELSAIQKSGAHIIFTTFSSEVGIPFAKQAGELKIPAAQVGINVESQKDGFWQATGGKGNYVMTLNTYARVKISDETIPFYDAYKKKFKEAPNYTAGTYDAIHILKDAIEKAGTLNPDKLVPVIEKTDRKVAAGRFVFTKNHDVKWGPGFITSIGTQWQDGKKECVWPYKWEGVTYEGTVPYKLAPWIVEYYTKKK